MLLWDIESGTFSIVQQNINLSQDRNCILSVGGGGGGGRGTKKLRIFLILTISK